MKNRKFRKGEKVWVPGIVLAQYDEGYATCLVGLGGVTEAFVPPDSLRRRPQDGGKNGK